MSARCNAIIHDKDNESKAILYRHTDGYPEKILPELERLVQKSACLLKETGYHWNCPERLAGMLVALSTDQNGAPEFVPCLNIHDDIACLYHIVVCEHGLPEVTGGVR